MNRSNFNWDNVGVDGECGLRADGAETEEFTLLKIKSRDGAKTYSLESVGGMVMDYAGGMCHASSIERNCSDDYSCISGRSVNRAVCS